MRAQIVGSRTQPGLNTADRGKVSLAIQRSYEIAGPNGSSRPVRGVEVYANLSPAEYGVAEGDVRAVMQANPGMSAEQAAQYLKGSLLAARTGGNMAQVLPTPPRNNNNTTTTALPGEPGATPGNGQTITVMQASELGMSTTTGADGAAVIDFEFSGPTAALDRAKWEASGY